MTLIAATTPRNVLFLSSVFEVLSLPNVLFNHVNIFDGLALFCDGSALFWDEIFNSVMSFLPYFIISVTLSILTSTAPSFSLLSLLKTNLTPQREAHRRSGFKIIRHNSKIQIIFEFFYSRFSVLSKLESDFHTKIYSRGTPFGGPQRGKLEVYMCHTIWHV